jgi:hypothetical protein
MIWRLGLTCPDSPDIEERAMAQSILIFDFGTDEEAAQQARHKFEGWKQAFRLGTKLQLKFDRVADEAEEPASGEAKASAGKKRAKKPAKEANESEADAHIRILIRLDFSDHEKLSHQRWLDRIPAEEPFKSAKSETVRQADETFAKTAELFDSLD